MHYTNVCFLGESAFFINDISLCTKSRVHQFIGKERVYQFIKLYQPHQNLQIPIIIQIKFTTYFYIHKCIHKFYRLMPWIILLFLLFASNSQININLQIQIHLQTKFKSITISSHVVYNIMQFAQQPKHINLKSKIKLERINEVIDYEYDYFGNKVAVSDSEGNVIIYARDGDKFTVHSEFKASNSSIWKISWAHPKFGELIAIGSFSKKVGVFQFRGNQWIQVAFHELHQSSVNEVVWAPYYFGLKLFACSSDGSFSLLELKDNNWSARVFKGHQFSINSITVQKRSIVQNFQGYEQTMPNIVTGSKDKTIALWCCEQGEYKQKIVHSAHKQPVRKVLWRQPSYRPSGINVFSCSQDGTLKLHTVVNNEFVQKVILNENNPIVKISQSQTGDVLIASFSRQDSNVSLILKEQQGQWIPIQQFNNQ